MSTTAASSSIFPPPAYEPRRSEDTETSLLVPEDGNIIRISASDILGLRTQILSTPGRRKPNRLRRKSNPGHAGNLPLLYTMRQGPYRSMPNDPGVITYRNAGRTYACVVADRPGSKKSAHQLVVLLDGPPADTTELALRGLLEKSEVMLGRETRKYMNAMLLQKVDEFYLKEDES